MRWRKKRVFPKCCLVFTSQRAESHFQKTGHSPRASRACDLFGSWFLGACRACRLPHPRPRGGLPRSKSAKRRGRLAVKHPSCPITRPVEVSGEAEFSSIVLFKVSLYIVPSCLLYIIVLIYLPCCYHYTTVQLLLRSHSWMLILNGDAWWCPLLRDTYHKNLDFYPKGLGVCRHQHQG